jgi:hypothetical protein
MTHFADGRLRRGYLMGGEDLADDAELASRDPSRVVWTTSSVDSPLDSSKSRA